MRVYARARVIVLAIVVAGSISALVSAQRFSGLAYEPTVQNAAYDGRFTFARLRYTVGPGGYYYRGLPAWAHGYDHAEANLNQILDSISAVHPRLDTTNVFALDDPRL